MRDAGDTHTYAFGRWHRRYRQRNPFTEMNFLQNQRCRPWTLPGDAELQHSVMSTDADGLSPRKNSTITVTEVVAIQRRRISR